jgi:hypothetical protein
MPVGNFFQRVSSTLNSNNNKLFLVIIATIICVLIDSQLGIIADFIPEYLSSSGGIALFLGLIIVFIIASYLMIKYIKNINVDSVRAFHLDVMYYVLIAAQCTMAFILTIVAFQILTNHEYNIYFLYISHLVNYGIWISILAFLAYAFFSWYRNYNRNIMVLIFAFSMAAYVINGIFSLIGQLDMLVQQNPIISSNTIAYFPEFSIDSFGSHVETVSLISSTIAYILTWVGSVKLLYQTFKRFGKFKFWAIMISSLVYYNITFPLFVLGYFNPSTDTNAIRYIRIFSLGGVFTGIIFGISFLSVAKTLGRDTPTRNYIMCTAYGFLLFYITGSAIAAQAAYPPFGLISISFIGLSCYLIYTGLYSSALIVSQDTTLLRSIKNSVTEQSKLLGSMGTAHRRKELESRVLTITKRLAEKTEESGVESSLTETEIKDYIKKVVTEIEEHKK